VVTPFETADVVKDDDPDDNKIIECALAAGADAIVTGDKHLLRLGQYGGIRIVRVREFLKRRSRLVLRCVLFKAPLTLRHPVSKRKRGF
jgi:predicted nucleic acid-binding protein